MTIRGSLISGYFLFAVIAIVSVFASSSSAHEISSGYLTLKASEDQQYKGTLALSPLDLEAALGLDANADGELTWQEVRASQNKLAEFISTSLVLVQNAAPCDLTVSPVALSSISGQSLITLPFAVNCSESGELIINYQGIFNLNNSHKVLVTLSRADQTYLDVLSSERRQVVVNDTQSSSFEVFAQFVYEGVIHIWIGIDHILFLLAALLTVNLVRENQRWVGQTDKWRILKETVYLVTAFTVAHSITLTTTALGWYQLNSRWVEFGIAVSVLLTALNNIWPVIYRLGWITFAFGLLHGMGFASVFAELQANAANPILPIAAFNIGVELGQLAIVLVILPVLLELRRTQWYARAIMPATSSVIAFIALGWAFQRW